MIASSEQSGPTFYGDAVEARGMPPWRASVEFKEVFHEVVRAEHGVTTNLVTGALLTRWLMAGLAIFVVGCGADGPAARGGGDGIITGLVESSEGPEAGVWVIAETTDTETPFRKIVVTNDDGMFLLPELPEARYDVWVRGYGLLDSEPVRAALGDDVRLTPRVAPTPREAARSYPADSWLAMIDLPDAGEFPGTGPAGNGISPLLLTQDQWIDNLKWCVRCHQLGNAVTRTIPDLHSFESMEAAWDDRVQRGQRGPMMNSYMSVFGRERGLEMFADWTRRIAAGEAPEAPPRPSGVERNVVLTVWDWADSVAFMHDEIATDKRNPLLYPFGPVYGVDIGNDYLTIVDPVGNSADRIKVPLKEDAGAVDPMFGREMMNGYRDFGYEPVWDNPANPHNPMMDAEGRVWLTTQVQGGQTPEWCQDGSDHPSAALFPKNRAGRHAGYYDPASGEFTLIGTCFTTHHLQFAEDADNTLWFSGDVDVTGWLNTRVWDQTHDEQAAQGWCARVIDTNGDGRITRPWNEPGALVDPTRDTRHRGFAYGVIVNPVDGSIWWVIGDEYPGRLYRLDPGESPPGSCVTEFFEIPSELGFRPRGVDVDRNGVVWMGLAGSASLASFERSLCEGPLSGPETIEGRHCDEGWRFHPVPGPTLEGSQIGADFFYYNWVDQFNTLGLGENVPIVNGSGSNSLKAYLPDTDEWVVLRVPYPQGFYSRGMDGRIDDPDAGWKGRGVYATSGADAAWHIEGGPHQPGVLIKFQIRPDPLAQ